MSIYLKSLEIFGFKSFGTRTYIEFSEGITGIVGPNGCGKSNVVESMKWVLGEQSARSLRGEKMQDIIFAGTKHRTASGMADVALTFNNELKWLPLDFPEVSIGRRVFRSGEGQYFVNGVRSRLKDTTELFLDTGVGKDSYAIFEQGKIDRLLSESAEDRRILFEDFAGISKFKFRKEEAEKKLAQARENLERLQETIDRLEKEINVLEIQAIDAENYNAINNELREMEVKFEVARVNNMKREITRRENEIIKLKEALAPMTIKLNEIEEQIKLSDASLGEKESQFGHMNEQNIKLEKELSASKIRYESAKKNITDSNIRLHEITIRSKQDLERIEEWEEILLEKQDAITDAEKKQQLAKKILDTAEASQQELKNKSLQLEENLLELSKEHGFKKVLSHDDINNIRKKIAELQGQLYVQESTIISLEDDIKLKTQYLQEEEQEFQQLQKKLEIVQQEKELVSTEKNTIVSQIHAIEQEILSLEKDYKKIIEQSKECDKIILTNMDQQIVKLKDFQTDYSIRKSSLITLLDKSQEIVQKGSPITTDMFNELRNTINAHEDAYTVLLSDIFGEGGTFSEKIIISEKMDQIALSLENARANLTTVRQNLDEVSQKENVIFQQVAEIDMLHKSSQKEFIKTEKNIAQLSYQKTQAQGIFELEKSQMITNSSKLEKIETIVSEYDKKLTDIRNKNYQFQEELTNARINYNSTETQSKALQNDMKTLEERITDYRRQITNFEHDAHQITKRNTELQEEIEDLLIEQDELTPELARIQEDMKQHFTAIADLRQTKKVLEHMHKENVEQFNKLRMRESEIEGSLSERKATMLTMVHALKEQFNISDTDITLDKEETTDLLNNRIRQYRDKLHQMGNVNLLAIEQFQTTKEQYATLIYQKEDIEKATNDTEILINDTNKESAEKFVVAFEQIRKSFRALFSELFNGGKADLILKDKEDPLRSGIDIMAEPPGQKFQNVSLLSGGQRAMVAIAVIFSILELKPTPFVILDEMDAPLDDENIDRFKRLLVRFKGTSQFVVVSHSKSTLEVCDVLFGVTMEELGCSKVVSVAFDESEDLLFAE
mgnify:CR=1 FL=1